MIAQLRALLVLASFDPDVARRLVAGDVAATGLALDERARAWLSQVDPRAFATDPHRRARMMTTILAEFPCTSARWMLVGGEDAPFRTWWSGPALLGALAPGGSLVEAFAQHVEAHAALDSAARSVLAIESAVARTSQAGLARRFRDAGPRDLHGPHPSDGDGDIVAASPWVCVLPLPPGALELWQRQRRALGIVDEGAPLVPERIAARVVEFIRAGRRLPVGLPSAPPGGTQGAMRQPETPSEAFHVVEFVPGQGAAIGRCSDGLAALLGVAGAGVRRERLRAELEAEGLDRVEADTLIDELLGDGLLWQPPDHSDGGSA